MNDYIVYLTSIGNGWYHAFIKSNAANADFIRIIISYTEIRNKTKLAKVSNVWIISPLKPTDEPVFIQTINKQAMKNRRVWIAFQSMKRHKPKSIPLNTYIALSPSTAEWRQTIGATTRFEVKEVNSAKDLPSVSVTIISI